MIHNSSSTKQLVVNRSYAHIPASPAVLRVATLSVLNPVARILASFSVISFDQVLLYAD
jgi:hypothetical protein